MGASGLVWRQSQRGQWLATVDKTNGHYVITWVEDEEKVFVGDKVMATQVHKYYELEANGHVLDQRFPYFEDAAMAAKEIEEKRT